MWSGLARWKLACECSLPGLGFEGKQMPEQRHEKFKLLPKPKTSVDMSKQTKPTGPIASYRASIQFVS